MDRTVKLWDLATMALKNTLLGHPKVGVTTSFTLLYSTYLVYVLLADQRAQATHVSFYRSTHVLLFSRLSVG